MQTVADFIFIYFVFFFFLHLIMSYLRCVMKWYKWLNELNTLKWRFYTLSTWKHFSRFKTNLRYANKKRCSLFNLIKCQCEKVFGHGKNWHHINLTSYEFWIIFFNWCNITIENEPFKIQFNKYQYLYIYFRTRKFILQIEEKKKE